MDKDIKDALKNLNKALNNLRGAERDAQEQNDLGAYDKLFHARAKVSYSRSLLEEVYFRIFGIYP